MNGVDAYATSKQCSLASVFALAREMPRLRIEAVEPGITPGTGLGEGSKLMQFIFGQIITRLPPFAAYRSTPQQAAQVIAQIATNERVTSGLYFDEKGQPMRGSVLVHDEQFQERVITQTRAFIGEAYAEQFGC